MSTPTMHPANIYAFNKWMLLHPHTMSVYDYACDHYNEGWDLIVECKEPKELSMMLNRWDEWEQCHHGEPCKTLEESIALAAEYVGVVDDYRQDIINA